MNFLLTYLGSKIEISNKLSAPKFGVRIYKRRAPANCPLPYVVFTKLGGRPDYALAGEISDVGLVYQCDAYGRTDDEAEEVAELIRLAPLSGFRGLMGETYVHAVTIERESGPDDYRDDGSDQPYSRSSRDYRIHHERTVVHSS